MSDAPQENPATIPEKVSSLEILAAAGLPTPKHRLYLDASCFEPGNENNLLDKISAFAEIPRIIVRSAHEMESKFSGGAFCSEETNNVHSFYPDSRIRAARSIIIEKSKPANSPRVRRDIHQRNIENFNPENMGVYLNEVVPSIRQITVVPLDNGQISLRYFNNDEIRIEDIDPKNNPPKHIYILEQRGARKIPLVVNRQALIEDIKKAQACFDTPQEFEIQIIQDGNTDMAKWVFVQAKSVTAESTQNDTIPEKEYDEGAKYYHPNSGTEGDRYKVLRANNRDIVRHTSAITIDEAEWIKEWIVENIKGEMQFGRFCPSDRTRFPDGVYNMSSISIFDFLYAEPECAKVIMDKYSELIELATKTGAVTVIKKTTRVTDKYCPIVHHDPNSMEYKDEIKKTMRLREELLSLASVVFQGMTEGDNDTSADHHTVFGGGNIAQITILYQGNLSISNIDDWKNIKRMKKLKDGDCLTVMIKNGVASLHVPELEEETK